MSTLKERINADLKSAMLARDTVKTQMLQGLKAAILNEEVAKGTREVGLSEQKIEQIVAHECKKRDEAAELFEKGGNTESAAKERTEKSLLSIYLPKQLSDDEIRVIIAEVIADLRPDGARAIGKVIGAVKTKVGTAADGAAVAKLVKESLS